MPSPPTAFNWTGTAMEPTHPKLAASRFPVGGPYYLAEVEERSEVSHRHEFAWLRTAHATLPDDLAMDFPTPEHLRKRALISTGFCTMQDYACGTRAEALRWAEHLRQLLDPYTLIQVKEGVVRVFRAASQAEKAMGRAEFQASKQAILEWVANLLGVAPADLAKAEAA